MGLSLVRLMVGKGKGKGRIGRNEMEGGKGRKEKT